MAIKTKEGVHHKEKNCSAPTTPRRPDINAKQTDGNSHEHVTLTPSVKPIPNYLRSTISFSNHTNFHCLKKHQHASEAPTVLSSKERTALTKQTISSELSSEKVRKTHARTRSLPNINIRRGETNVSSPTGNAKAVGSPKAKFLENKQHKLSPLSRQVNGSSKCSEARKSKLKGRKEVEEEKKVEQEILNESANKVVAKTSKVKALVGKFETAVSLHEPGDDQPGEEMQVKGEQKPKEEEKEVVKEEIKDGEVCQKDQQEVKEETEGAQLGHHDQKEEEGKGEEGAELVVEREEHKEAKELTESGEKGA